jgi:dTDP-4-amino-4,6-dideoxygalactose transaminase
MPGMSFAATANAALYLGAKPVFADIDLSTGNVLVADVAAKITPKTKAIVAVDFAGQPCDLEPLRALADHHKLPLIVDGAHSIGATYKDKPAAGIPDLTTFSFHPVKSITTGEGGMIVTNNEHFDRRMRRFRTHGIEKDASRFEHESHGPWYHEMQDLGFNYRLSDFQAALGLSQLSKLDSFLKRRREIASQYNEAFASLSNFEISTQRPDAESAFHLYPILVKKAPRAAARKFAVKALHAENIGVQIHYIPIYRHPYYEKTMTTPVCPNTDAFYDRIINLPIFPLMSENDVRDVVVAVRKVDEALHDFVESNV